MLLSELQQLNPHLLATCYQQFADNFKIVINKIVLLPSCSHNNMMQHHTMPLYCREIILTQLSCWQYIYTLLSVCCYNVDIFEIMTYIEDKSTASCQHHKQSQICTILLRYALLSGGLFRQKLYVWNDKNHFLKFISKFISKCIVK